MQPPAATLHGAVEGAKAEDSKEPGLLLDEGHAAREAGT